MEKITATKIRKISNLIAKHYKPEKIILFGSFAWGKPTEDSDVDLLIIKKTRKKTLKRHIEVGRIINGQLPVDTLIRTPAEVKHRLKLGDFFYEDVVNKGKCLYEKPNK